jgi:hypothetical protein
VKVRIGSMGDFFGTIESTPSGLKFDGDQARIQEFVDLITMGGDPKDAPGGYDGFLRYLASPSVNNGYNNVTEVPE